MDEDSNSLKSALEVVSTFELKMAKADAELELSNLRCAQSEEREKRQAAKLKDCEAWLAAMKLELEKVVTEKVTIEADRDSIEA